MTDPVASDLGLNPAGPEAQAVEETVVPGERASYRLQVEQLLVRGYSPSLELAEAAYTMLQLLRIRTSMEKDVASDRPSTKQTLDAYGDMQATLRTQLLVLDKKQSAISAADPNRELQQAEAWVMENLGEFEYRCPSPACGQILTIPSLPHWAYAPVYVDSTPVWMVWSPELWALVIDQTIALWSMAYCLRTSPEALRITAERRGEPWPTWIDLEAEETALAVRLRAMDRQALAISP